MLELVLVEMIGGKAMPEGTLSNAKVGQIALAVSDLEAARSFYIDKLGLKLAIDAGSMLFFDCGGTMLMLSLPEKEVQVNSDGAVVYFSVDGIRERWQELRANDVEFVDEPHVIHRAGARELWMTFFRDPDGHLLALMSWQMAGDEQPGVGAPR